MAELKQCPFCGRIPTVEDCGTNRWFVRCKCGIAQDKLYHQRCDAVRAWNRRKPVTDVPSAEVETQMSLADCISRQAAIDVLEERLRANGCSNVALVSELNRSIGYLMRLPSAQPEYTEQDMREQFNAGYACGMHAAQPEHTETHSCDYQRTETHGWIPVTEALPEDIRPVIVTWKNNDPESYYQYIVGKHFIGVAHFKGGKWYWYSSTTEDFLAEYGRYDGEEFDEAIEVVAWCELPEPYKEGQDGTRD